MKGKFLLRAREVSLEIVRSRGYVTGPLVLKTLREDGFVMDEVDPRWLGILFRHYLPLKKIGYTREGATSGAKIIMWGVV